MNQNNRQLVIIGIMLSIFAIFAIRLFYIQIIDESYGIWAAKNAIRRSTIFPARGAIFDRKGRQVVVNTPYFDLIVIPKQLEQPFDTATFCKILGIDTSYFVKRLQAAKQHSRYQPYLFLSQISPEDYAPIQERLFQFKGFYAEKRTVRRYLYPNGGHVLGYVGEASKRLIAESGGYYQMGDYVGIAGVELGYEQYLRGIKGVKYEFVDVLNRVKGSFKEGAMDTPAKPGTDIYLSLDMELQALGEQLMANKRGSVVAIEPQTGEILAFISSPAYDPNSLVGLQRGKTFASLYADPLKPLFNRPLMAQYPPGSTFKLVMAAVGQQEGVLNPQTNFSDNFSVGSKRVNCHPHPANLNLSQAIQYSCNPYFCYTFTHIVGNKRYKSIAEGYQAWRDHILSFSIGQKTGIDLPNERPGNVPSVGFYDKIYGAKRWRPVTIYSLGIGQGEMGITPLQLANTMSIFANQGYYYTPHVIKWIGKERLIPRRFTIKHKTSVDKEHFESLLTAMRDVVIAGTARSAQIPGIDVMGKTGTVQNPHGKDHSLFIAAAPSTNPKIAIAVVVENSGFGATWAAPIASLMMEQYLNDSISRPQIYERLINANLIQP